MSGKSTEEVPVKRPVYLNLFTIHFPVMAWVSILHRLSGFFLFLLIPGLLWMLQESLASESRLLKLKTILETPAINFGIWLLFAALLYHLVAGVRHLLLDIHIWESKRAGHISSWCTLVVAACLVALAGYYLWSI